MSEDNVFDGFMPMIDGVNITPSISMINTDGDLIKAHSIKITTRDGVDYVFSMDTFDLMKLCFLIMKVVNQ
jgi:hypothetical protein